jgi:3-oxoacyl-[acyl-carrier protein] reductase/7-alpha-hydroxysteroid dehydrogenase
MKFDEKVVVVTGGSRGIGFATVKAFLAEGATVVLCASRKETADTAMAQLKETDANVKAEAIYPNLADYNEVKTAFDSIIEKYGKIDILVNNAGISNATPFGNYTEDEFEKVMDLNVKAVYNCSRAVVDNMTANKYGVILNTSSMVSISGQPSGVAYPTSKFAVNGFTLSLARELGPKGIRVNAVAPGIIETDMMKAVPKEVIEPMKARIPLARLGQPEDIANAFVFLASDEASYITGVVLSVDGLMRT